MTSAGCNTDSTDEPELYVKHLYICLNMLRKANLFTSVWDTCTSETVLAIKARH